MILSLLIVSVASLNACSSEGGSSADFHGISAACESSSDCNAPLSCNSDPVNHLLDKQCTAPCASDQPCDASLGPNAACLLSNLCVHTCTNDTGCPSSTTCNEYGWCERVATPPTPTTHHCTGTTTSCAAVKYVNCANVPGCSPHGQCTGEPKLCSSQGSDCFSLLGCEYDLELETCTGEPRACDQNDDYTSCTKVLGCTWEYSCAGTPRQCELLTADVCEKAPGCQLE